MSLDATRIEERGEPRDRAVLGPEGGLFVLARRGRRRRLRGALVRALHQHQRRAELEEGAARERDRSPRDQDRAAELRPVRAPEVLEAHLLVVADVDDRVLARHARVVNHHVALGRTADDDAPVLREQVGGDPAVEQHGDVCAAWPS